MAQKGFYFDASRCTGCRTCETACKDYYDTEVTTNYRKVFDCEGGECSLNDDGTVTNKAFVYHVSMACNHCTMPACVEACPTGAMHKEEETGLVLVDWEICIGCGSCVQACPYNAPKVSGELQVSVKCTGCYDRITEDKDPICVSACPLRALDFGDIDELKEKYPYAEVLNIAPFPSKDLTQPNTIVQPCPDLRPSGDEDVIVSNEPEVAKTTDED